MRALYLLACSLIAGIDAFNSSQEIRTGINCSPTDTIQAHNKNFVALSVAVKNTLASMSQFNVDAIVFADAQADSKDVLLTVLESELDSVAIPVSVETLRALETVLHRTVLY